MLETISVIISAVFSTYERSIPVTDQHAHAGVWSIYWHQLWRPTAAKISNPSIKDVKVTTTHRWANQRVFFGLVGGIATLFAGVVGCATGVDRDFYTRKSLASTDINHVKSFFNDNPYQLLPDKHKAIFDDCTGFLKKTYVSHMPRSSSSRELIELIKLIETTQDVGTQSTLKQELFEKCKAFINDPEGCHLGKTTYALMVNHISTNLQSEATKQLTINGI